MLRESLNSPKPTLQVSLLNTFISEMLLYILFSEPLKVVKISSRAITPRRGSLSAAGIDLAAPYDSLVPAQGKVLIRTALKVSSF